MRSVAGAGHRWGLSRHDQTVVVFCMLIVVFSHNTVARRDRITGKLLIFFAHMSRGTANFDVRPVAVISTVAVVTLGLPPASA